MDTDWERESRNPLNTLRGTETPIVQFHPSLSIVEILSTPFGVLKLPFRRCTVLTDFRVEILSTPFGVLKPKTDNRIILFRLCRNPLNTLRGTETKGNHLRLGLQIRRNPLNTLRGTVWNGQKKRGRE